MSHIRLFERPSPNGARGGQGLYIEGALPDAKPSLAYEGRLSVVNLGSASAEVVSVVGSLPPGATVSVDNAADQVVVAWPEFQANVAPIPNADFELGDQQWLKGPGWSIVQNNVNDDPNTLSSEWTARYADQGGSVELRNALRVAVTAGQAITASCRVQQGASSEGNAGAAVRLFFQSASGAEVMREGNLVDSGSNSQWKTSTLNTTSPVTGTVQIGCRGKRHRQNHPLWVDNFAWNVTEPSVGTNVEGTIGPITIRIRDSLGREAEWTGSINVTSVQYDGFDPASATAGVVLANGNTVLSCNQAGVWAGVRSVGKHSTGKRYVEFPIVLLSTTAGFNRVGLCVAGADLDASIGTAGFGTHFAWAGWFNTTAVYHSRGYSAAGQLGGADFQTQYGQWYDLSGGGPAECRVQLSVDFDAGKAWFRIVPVNDPYRDWAGNTNGVIGDPATGANPTFTFTPNTELYLFAQAQFVNAGNQSSMGLLTNPDDHSHAPPDGFTAGWPTLPTPP